MILLAVAAVAAVVGIRRRNAWPALWFTAAAVATLFAAARLGDRRYFAPGFVLAIPAALWLFRRRSSPVAAPLVWVLVAIVVVPTFLHMNGPAHAADQQVAQDKAATQLADRLLKPNQVALVSGYTWDVPDARWWGLVEDFVTQAPNYPYRFLPDDPRALADGGEPGARMRATTSGRTPSASRRSSPCPSERAHTRSRPFPAGRSSRARASPPSGCSPGPERSAATIAAVTTILGINAYHGDAAAALVDRRRARRRRRGGALQPRQALRRLPVARRRAGASRTPGSHPADLDHVAVSRDPRANLGRKLLRTVRHGASARYLKARLQNASRVRDVGSALAEALGIDGVARPDPQRRAPSGARRLRLLRLAVRGRGDPLDRRLRRLRLDDARRGARQPLRRAGADHLPALARHLLHRRHAVARLPEVRRRGQGDGPRPVRDTALPREDARPRPPRRAARSSSASTTSRTTRKAST